MSLFNDRIVRVVINVPLRKSFDYQYHPADHSEQQSLKPGMRVVVPFGRATQIAVITEVDVDTDVDASKLKFIKEILDNSPVLNDEQLSFLSWAADYYHHPIGEVYFSALPTILRQARNTDDLIEQQLVATTKLPTADKISTRASLQHKLLALLEQGSVDKTTIKEHNISSPTVKTFIDNKWCEWLSIEPTVKSVTAEDLHSGLQLNTEQAIALSAINNSERDRFLLEGVTGSGKTEVYLQAIEQVLLKQKQVLVLVPEIGLTPQTVSRFQQRFNVKVSQWHSGMTDKQRFRTWYSAKTGESAIIIATRSGVFLPFNNLGMIILDEEHDDSFKQQEGFKYHCRSIALYRGQKNQIPVVLGTATPSLESAQNVESGKFKHLKLKQRATGYKMPTTKLVDLNLGANQAGVSKPLLERLQQIINDGKQAMLFINRRGYAPVIMCEECHWLTNCPRCSSYTTYHKNKRKLICHHCGYQHPVYHQCQSCGSTRLTPVGVGTEQLEQLLTELFPSTPIIRLDRDKTAKKGEFEQAVEQINSGESMIIVGTQMIAKGHHFSNVELVGILDVDGALFSSDFRSSEKLAQLIVQVSGRAGRESQTGEVWLQTKFPEHPVIQDLVNNTYADIAAYTLKERRTLELPPYSHMIVLRAEAQNEHYASQWLQQIEPHLTQFPQLVVLGPTPAPMTRKAGKYRYMLTLQCNSRGYLHKVVDWLIENLDRIEKDNKIRWSIDVDPVDLS